MWINENIRIKFFLLFILVSSSGIFWNLTSTSVCLSAAIEKLLPVPKARTWPLNISHERLVAAVLWRLEKWLTLFGQNN